MPARIIAKSMHRIDIDSRESIAIPLQSSTEDLANYLHELQRDIAERQSKRKFKFQSDTTEFFTTITNLVNLASEEELNETSFNNNLASRLLNKEIDSDQRMTRLSPSGHLKRGSFLQFFFEEDNTYYYLGVKVEHTSIIDENDFQTKIGMPKIDKSYKACRVSFKEDLSPDEILVYDTNNKIAVYWWREFLELEQRRTDSYNTETACKAIMVEVDRLKRDHPRDHTILRNTTIGMFRQNRDIEYNEVVDNIFDQYHPEDESLVEKLPGIKDKLKTLPEKKKFDTQFKTIPSSVPFRKRNINLGNDITLHIKEGLENIDDKIWASKLQDGRKVVMIQSEEGYRQFTKKIFE